MVAPSFEHVNTSYAKVFESLFDGSLRGSSDAILVWINILTHMRGDTSDVHFRKISDETGLPLERVKTACLFLEAPDAESRSKECEGRRMTRLDDHRDWGWRIVNADKYRNCGGGGKFLNKADLRKGGSSRSGYVYYALSPTENKIKIGFSANPWSRVKELEYDYAGAKLLAVEKGTYSTETERHAQFAFLRLEREWFKYEGELASYVAALRNVVPATHVPVPVPVPEGGVGEFLCELPSGFPKTVDDAIAHAAFVGCDPIFATSVWNKAMSRGGRDAREVPIRSWRHHLTTEWSYERNRLNKEKMGKINGNSRQPFISELESQMKAKQRQAESHPANPEAIAYRKNCTDLEKASLRQLRKDISELNNQIANGGKRA